MVIEFIFERPSHLYTKERSCVFCFSSRKAMEEFLARKVTFWPSKKQRVSPLNWSENCALIIAFKRLCSFAFSNKEPKLLPTLKFVGFPFVLSCIYEKIPQFC